MRQTIDPEAARLCPSCKLREEKRSPKKKEVMKTIDIVIKCPPDIHAVIEEWCMNNGMDFTKYFLELHESDSIRKKINKEVKEVHQQVDVEMGFKPLKPQNHKGKKK
jgi:hypothetical protein